MKVKLVPKGTASSQVEPLETQLKALGIETAIGAEAEKAGPLAAQTGQNGDWLNFFISHEAGESPSGFQTIIPAPLPNMVEQVISQLPVDFDTLPLLFEGESKIGRLLNEKIVVESFKPTVYSYTSNRYGTVEGTADLRIRFSAEIFRRMRQYARETGKEMENAFLGLIETETGPLMVQKRVDACNLEVRVKRFHIGSPIHRYKYTELYPTTHTCGPLTRWSRFDTPIVCFDWRHPLHDKEGNRLADEPISDDYAAVWIEDVDQAKYLAREVFLWLEQLFAAADLVLVDICFFIDRSGHLIFGEISPDCMRVREQVDDPDKAASYDKDIWRSGEKSSTLLEKYTHLYHRLFEA